MEEEISKIVWKDHLRPVLIETLPPVKYGRRLTVNPYFCPDTPFFFAIVMRIKDTEPKWYMTDNFLSYEEMILHILEYFHPLDDPEML